MDASGFLHLVWPETGYYCIATQNPRKTYDHYVFDTIDAAAEAALSLDRQHKNVFYCMSSLTEKSVRNKETNTIQYRVKTNLANLQVFFFELDVANPTDSEAKKVNKYASREEALAALKKFLQQINWPQPTIVSSGGGFHVYFPLTNAIPTHEYEHVAKQLKRAARALDFHLDANALDLTRVFRVVGTHNYKLENNPRPVEMLKPSVAYDPQALITTLDAASENLGVKETKNTTPDYLDFGTNNTQVTYDGPPAQYEDMLRCHVIKTAVDAGGAIPYAHWWRVGQVLRHAENGREYFHKLSSGSSDYDAEYTDQVLDRFENNNIGPTLCATFDTEVGKCDGCEFKGRIKSPIVLGHKREGTDESLPPTVVLDANGECIELTIPNPPKPYVRSNGKLFIIVTNKDGEEFPALFSEYDMYPVKRVYHESQDREHVIWKVTVPIEGTREITMPSAEMYDKKIFTANLVSNGLYVPHEELDTLRNYMIAYIRELQRNVSRDHLFARNGWRDNNTRFVLGNTIYDAEGGHRCEMERSRVSAAIRSEGSLEVWKQAFSMYSHPKFVCHQFALATAFGSPLMTFTGITGGIINLLGTSGEGKSTIQRVVNSVWGHPLELMLPAESKGSTYYAKMNILGRMGNLPITAEEITMMQAEELGSLTYGISQGVERIRLTQEGKLRDSIGLWCLSMLSSSNSSLPDKVSGTEGAVAKALRIMELRVPPTTVYTKNDFERLVEHPIRRNFGHAGKIYAAYLARHSTEAAKLVEEIMYKIDMTLHITAEERIWSALAATNIAGWVIAKECGLHDMSAKPLFDYIVSQIKQFREKSKDTMMTAAELLAEYMNQHIQGMIIVDELVPNGRESNLRIIGRPTRSIIGRYDRVSGQAWIATNLFKAWCIKQGRVYQDTLTELAAQNIISNKSVLKVLGAGTEYKTGQVKSILINTNSEFFAGKLETAPEDSDDKSKLHLVYDATRILTDLPNNTDTSKDRPQRG